MRRFYLENDSAITIGQYGLLFLVVSLFFYGIWFFGIRVETVQNMTVRSKEWYREIKEAEDYRVWVCDTKYRDECSGSGGDRICRRESYRDCDWETRTRILQSWVTSGQYPIPPVWETRYTIVQGHYEIRYEKYTIYLSDDREIWTKVVWNERDYNYFPVKGKCEAGLNYFRSLRYVKDCK